MHILKRSWVRAWQGIGACGEGNEIRSALVAAYAEPRRRYAFVPEELFKQRRRALLGSFLARPRIYSTSHFQDLLVDRARENLQRACLSVENRSGASA